MKRIKGIKINKSTDYFNDKYTEYLYPENVYLPIYNYKLLVNKGDQVFVGEIILINKDGLCISSPVSGIIEDIDVKMFTNKSKIERCIKIKNDFKETKDSKYIKKDIKNKEDYIELLKEKNILGLGGGGFPAYMKIENSTLDYLIVNACECEPFLMCDYVLLNDKYRVIIKCIENVKNILELKKVYIAIKKDKKKLIDLMYKEIQRKKLTNEIKIIKVPSLYPVGYERYLVNTIFDKDYHEHPNEIGVLIHNVSTIYSIYEALEEGKPLIERIITLCGEGIKNNINVKVKIGTNLKELINKINEINRNVDKMYLISSGPMTGESFSSLDIIISPTMLATIFLPLNNKYKTEACLGCGRCNKYCPVSLTPTEISYYLFKKDKEELTKLKVDNCVSCGICSYVCPSRIDLTYNMKRAKQLLLKGEK